MFILINKYCSKMFSSLNRIEYTEICSSILSYNQL